MKLFLALLPGCVWAAQLRANERSNKKDPCHYANNTPHFSPPADTNCPKSLWVDAMVKADPVAGKVFMDIGCNKGNDAMKWMQRWDMSNFWSTQKWMDLYDTLGVTPHSCPGTTAEVRATAIQQNRNGTHNAFSAGKALLPIGVCVEPMAINIEKLHTASSHLGYEPSQTKKFGAFHIMQAAVMDKAKPGQTIYFPDGTAGQEDLGVHSFIKSDVPLKTVDGIKAELQLGRVDILLVDTEGADPAVLRGAVETLNTVRYLEFEVHRDLHNTEWQKTSLHSVVKDLDKMGFDCYWAGNQGILLSMNRCWADSFENGAWANAACVKRGDIWHEVLERFTAP